MLAWTFAHWFSGWLTIFGCFSPRHAPQAPPEPSYNATRSLTRLASMITGLLGHGRARALMHSSPRPLAPGLLPPSTCLLLTPYSSLLISVHLLASSGPLVHSLTLSHVPTHVTSSRVCICTLVSSNMCDIPYVSVSVCLHQHASILALHMFQMFPDITLRVSHVSTHLFTHGSYASAHVFAHMPQMSSRGSPMRYL